MSIEPLGAKLRRLRVARGLSQEEVAFRMHDADGKATGGAVGQFERGVTRPLPRTVEAIAAALDVPAEGFAEYRLALARRLLDEREVGLEAALANYETVREVLGLPEEPATPSAGAGAPPAPGELGRRIEEPQTSPRNQKRPDSGQGKGRRRGAA